MQLIRKPFTETERAELQRLCEAGVKPRAQLATIINDNLNRNLGYQDVYNANAKARLEFMNSRSPVQVLLDLAADKGYRSSFEIDEWQILT